MINQIENDISFGSLDTSSLPELLTDKFIEDLITQREKMMDIPPVFLDSIIAHCQLKLQQVTSIQDSLDSASSIVRIQGVRSAYGELLLLLRGIQVQAQAKEKVDE